MSFRNWNVSCRHRNDIFSILELHLGGRTSTDDAERSGRPNEVFTEENIIKVHRIVLDNRKIKVSEIAEMIKISTDRVLPYFT